jgi:hypothetical protein
VVVPVIAKVDVVEVAEEEPEEVEVVSVAEADAVHVEVSTRPKGLLAQRLRPPLLIMPNLLTIIHLFSPKVHVRAHLLYGQSLFAAEEYHRPSLF